jgi:hypothetical protein
VHDDAGTGDLHVMVLMAEPSARETRQGACSRSARCSSRSLPDGGTVLVWVYPRKAGTQYAHHLVEVFRGQTMVAIVATDSDRSMLERDPAPSRPTPVLSAEELTELALGPDLVLFP